MVKFSTIFAFFISVSLYIYIFASTQSLHHLQFNLFDGHLPFIKMKEARWQSQYYTAYFVSVCVAPPLNIIIMVSSVKRFSFTRLMRARKIKTFAKKERKKSRWEKNENHPFERSLSRSVTIEIWIFRHAMNMFCFSVNFSCFSSAKVSIITLLAVNQKHLVHNRATTEISLFVLRYRLGPNNINNTMRYCTDMDKYNQSKQL